jgi:hypothetical protein
MVAGRCCFFPTEGMAARDGGGRGGCCAQWRRGLGRDAGDAARNGGGGWGGTGGRLRAMAAGVGAGRGGCCAHGRVPVAAGAAAGARGRNRTVSDGGGVGNRTVETGAGVWLC